MTTPSTTTPPLPAHIQAQINKENERLAAKYAQTQPVTTQPLTPEQVVEATPPQPVNVGVIESIFAQPVTPQPTSPTYVDTGVDLFAAPAAVVAPATNDSVVLEEIRKLHESIRAQPVYAPAPTAPSNIQPLQMPTFDAASLGVPVEVQDKFVAAMTAFASPIIEHNNALTKLIADQSAASQQTMAENNRKIFASSLERVHSDYNLLHRDAGFKTYLDQPVSQFTPDITLKAAYARAWDAGDLKAVSHIIDSFKQTATPPAPVKEVFRSPATMPTAGQTLAASAPVGGQLVSIAAYNKVVDGYQRKRVSDADMMAATAVMKQAVREQRLTA